VDLSHKLDLEVQAELLPEQKLEAIRQAHREYGVVAMIGDGLNDAPALAAADIGIALGCGADVSRESADICLLSSDLRLLPWLCQFSRRTVRAIRSNLIWSFAYNSIGVVLAASGQLHPALAAVLMVVSSLAVLGNSLKLSLIDAPDPASPDSLDDSFSSAEAASSVRSAETPR
jgi:P-type E1-E2 ATPase